MVNYDDILNSNISREEKARLIAQRGQEYRDSVQRQLWKDRGRIAAGSLVSGLSFLPIMNIPVAGTALGGGLYELGQGIAEGDSLGDIAKRTGVGVGIGATVGAIPYVGKGANKLSGDRIGNAITSNASKVVEAFNNSGVGRVVKPKLEAIEDALMTDIIPSASKKPVYYHGTAAKFDEFSPEFIGTAHDEGLYGKGYYFTPHKSLARSYAQSARNGESPRVIAANLEMKNPLKMEDFNSAEEIAKYLNMEENIGDFIPVEYGNKTIYRPNGFLQQTGKFKGRVQDLGHDGVIVGNNEAVVYNPKQIHQIENPTLADYLMNESVLTKGYRTNKETIDKALMNGKRKMDAGVNPFSKATREIEYNEMPDDVFERHLLNDLSSDGYKIKQTNNGYNLFDKEGMEVYPQNMNYDELMSKVKSLYAPQDLKNYLKNGKIDIDIFEKIPMSEYERSQFNTFISPDEKRKILNRFIDKYRYVINRRDFDDYDILEKALIDDIKTYYK